jgi:hypothetical protein
MICALTVRKLKPGTFEEFRKAFLAPMEAGAPEGFVRFNMVRSTTDPDEVICFGFFDGTVDELRASAEKFGYEQQVGAISPFVESVGTDGFFDIVEDRVP